jgi:hypothetical protein
MAGRQPAAQRHSGIDLGRRATLFGVAATFLAVASRPAAAMCPVDRDRRLGYAMRVSGAHIADLDLRLRCAGTFAMVEMEVTNRGVAAWIAGRNRTSMTALVAFNGDDQPHPARFRASYQKPDRLRETELEFAPDGSLTHLVTRNQGRPQESPVPEDLREPSIDPLATFLRLSDWVAGEPELGESVAVPVFEGRKRADLETIYRGRVTLQLGGSSRPAHHLQAAVQGISGFDDSDNFVTLPGEPLDWIDAYASDEPTPVPLLITNTSRRLPTRIELVRG